MRNSEKNRIGAEVFLAVDENNNRKKTTKKKRQD